MIAVIVVTYNATKYLSDLLGSLERTLYDGAWKLIVVDNASTDETRRFISNFQFPRPTSHGRSPGGRAISNFQLLENQKNLGFAEGNNVGIRVALREGADFVVLLNHDTVVEPDWLAKLERAMQADPRVGAAQPRLMLWPEKEKVNSIGNAIHYLGFGYAQGYKRKFEISNLRFEIPYASGAAVMYRVAAIREVGLLDASFFMYHEDLDLGWRLWMAGWKNVLVPDAVVYHKYEFSRSIKKYYFMERNRFLVLLENYRIGTLLLLFPALIVMELGLLVKAIFSGWGMEKLRAYLFFFKPSTWALITRERRTKQRTRRVSDRMITKHFTGKLEFQEFESPIVRYVMNPVFNLYWQIVRRLIFW